MKYLPPPLILLLRWHYSPMWTFTYLMDFSQSALFFDISYQFLVLDLFIFVFLVILLGDFPGDYYQIPDLLC